ncbi:MAG: hypothetical protein P8P30_03830 [Rickettsiales bacterium]|nr:hypothetical protein [Rickettsiales bacterium]
MPFYAITYDLNNEKNYPKIQKEFEKLNSHKAAYSFYLVKNTASTKQMLEHFKQFVDEDDTLVVVRIDDVESYRPLKGTNDWIKQNT